MTACTFSVGKPTGKKPFFTQVINKGQILKMFLTMAQKP
jgi:hypothetical protein